MMMKIAIIGSRNYTNKTQIKNFMFRLKMEYKDMEIVSGGAKDGADKYAKKFALEFGLDYRNEQVLFKMSKHQFWLSLNWFIVL